ncbi:DNA primase [Candidatus Gottesmanbacteria bacterium RIFCSPLOWO2_01_FULL_46_21]|uniref:DNA primase n=2 Tax=Microgenomates group TaxID=1794810 RepID=A0A1F6B0D5_9BACT|nr:MAG: primase protein [Candidatus Curtissbacteria bacterium GW2011_GWA1_41_11]OGG30253.1 MAG: DNA primase [Candidatus Gottesmanbacteria bacterium RIFCSPLOWO2_01_FULL_46_21]
MSDIDEVKSRLNIVDIIGAKVPLKKNGRHFKALCPFHNEKTPSFIVSPERQMWKCFGCGKGGSVIDFVMEYEHMDFVEALEELAQKAGVKLERRVAETPQAQLKQQLYAVNHLASEYFQYILTKHALGEKARQYLKHRGVTDKAIKTFALGYSPNSWDALARFLRKKGYEPKVLELAGLLVPSPRGGYDRFRGRVIFTLRDHRGNVVGFSGRHINSDDKEAKYINSSETPVYNKSNVLYGLDITKDAISKANEAILMEGEFDVISSFQAGISNVVAIKGSALTEGHVNLLKRFTERVIFALDSDVAGDAASRRGIEIADRAGLDMRVLVLPDGKDPDEAVRTNPGLVKKAIAEAVPIYDYFMSSALKRFDIQTPFGKRKLSDELLPVLAGIENIIVQSHYIKKLAGVLDTSTEAVSEGIVKAGKAKQRKSVSLPQADEIVQSRSEKIALYILALILQGEARQWYGELIEQIAISDIDHPAIQKVLEFLKTYFNDTRQFSVTSLASVLPAELVPTLDSAFLLDIGASLEDLPKRTLEWQRALRELKRDILHRKIKNLTSQVGESPQAELVKLTATLQQLENPS